MTYKVKERKKMQRVTTIRQTAAKKHTSVATWLARILSGFCLVLAALGVLLVVLNHNSNAHVVEYWVENNVIPLIFSPDGAVIIDDHAQALIERMLWASGFLGAGPRGGAG